MQLKLSKLIGGGLAGWGTDSGSRENEASAVQVRLFCTRPLGGFNEEQPRHGFMRVDPEKNSVCPYEPT